MRLSTVVELVGFGCGVAAAFTFGTTAGLAALFVTLLVIGYSIEDEHAALSMARLIHPITHRHMLRKARRAAKKAG